MNTAMMLKVADWIDAHPEHFDMGSYQDDGDGGLPGEIQHAFGASALTYCGATCCVAGAAVAIALDERLVSPRGDPRAIGKVADDLLGLGGDGDTLFYAHETSFRYAEPAFMASELRRFAALGRLDVRHPETEEGDE